MQGIGFTGLFDIDFYESDGKYYFGEMNMRYGASGYSLFKEGINLPEMLYRSLCGQRVDSAMKLTHPSSFINERVCVDDWFAGGVSSRELKDDLKNKELGFVYDSDDMAPYHALKSHIRRLSFRRNWFLLNKRLMSAFPLRKG